MKQVNVIILVVSSLVMTHWVYGQNNEVGIQNRLSVQAGISYLDLKDRTFSPINMSGVAPQFSVAFNQNNGNRSLWSTGIAVTYGNINHKNQLFPTTYAGLQLHFNYLRRIKSFSSSAVYLGGQYKSVANILDYDGFTSGSWYTAQQLEIILKYHYAIAQKHQLAIQFSYPLASLVSRPRYGGLDELIVINSDNIPKILYSKMKIYTINKLLNPNIELAYHYQLSKATLSLAGSYDYLQVNSVREYFKNQWSIALGFHLKFT